MSEKLNHLLDMFEDPMRELYDLEVETLTSGIYLQR